ncbi:uncharacterized protein PITG_04873 [Phytophthora infestans T30-4]|uniref:Uncharacterized protein n=1 Tax=Phytophthora infestans (strain T30-4) TaxID=403677 RepID=D0N288_PHYIT|nr:uncharacterized protein PITG_04873 [Phytophthora infestans T30-4]EEY68417.1 conserved hypothetical protein [Phytophthora infestans T30-4]|eukprot:XP_002905576.1 conserved hypothetical protein [Phytophthora infestans T30-4]
MEEEPSASSRGRWLARRRTSRGDSGGSRGDSSPPLTALASLLLSSQPPVSMTDARVLAISRGTSVGDDDDPTDASPNVYKFNVAQYKDGSFRFVPACARDLIKYTGRLLHHGAQSARKTKINTVQFDWPAVAFQISVRGTSSVAIRLKGDVIKSD